MTPPASPKVQEMQFLLNARRLPARLTTLQVATVLGFQEHDIAPLVTVKLLSPLGRPASNAPKYFSAAEIEVFAHDREWLSKATKALSDHWLKKKKKGKGNRLEPLHEAA